MPTHLILGGTGKTGRRITDLLRAAGHTARPASRHPGDDGVRFDWDDPGGWDAALRGVDTLYVVPPAYVVEHADRVAALMTRAAAAGVGRAVFLSARGVDADDGIPLRRSELAALGSDVPTVVIRPTWFAQNVMEGVLPADPAGVVALPAGDGRVPFIDTGDIAAVAVHLLTTPDLPAGEAFDLSGPEALGFAELVEESARATGRPLRYADVPAESWVAAAVGAGVPADYAGLLAGLAGIVRDGHDAATSDGVRRLLGRDPVGVREALARDAAAA